MTDVARCDWRTFLDAAPDTPVSVVEALDRHFSAYCQPEITSKDGVKSLLVNCPKCQKQMNDALNAVFFGGGFTWGLAHGEGHCAHCGWPASGHHFVRDHNEAPPVITISNFPLAYHPDCVSTPAERESV